MKISKQIIAFSLATCLTLSPFMVDAKTEKKAEDIGVVSSDKTIKEQEKLLVEYVEYTGKIVKVEDREKSNSILVKDNEKEEYNGKVYHLDENVIILDAKTKEIVTKKAIKEGILVTVYTHKNTPVAESLPPQSTPSIILINSEKDIGNINVSKFNEDLVNAENTLKLLIDKKTIIINQSGEKVEKEDLINRDLIVFYSVSTRSIPAQAPAQKIILMDGKEGLEEDIAEDELPEIKVLDKIVINGKEIFLEDELYNKDGVTMVPLRQISEALGYEVTWNNESRAAELTKGAQWTAVKIGEDNYSFAKMLVKLGIAPEIKDGSTFVPISFLEEILKVSLQITESGMINIIE